MFKLIIRAGAARDEVTVQTEVGKTVVDRSTMGNKERHALRELVVNSFCRATGRPEMYNEYPILREQ